MKARKKERSALCKVESYPFFLGKLWTVLLLLRVLALRCFPLLRESETKRGEARREGACFETQFGARLSRVSQMCRCEVSVVLTDFRPKIF